MQRDRLSALLTSFPNRTILVVGDFFLDKYLIIDHSLAEISLETGLEAHQVTQVRCQPGAAGTVTANLAAMGVGVIALSVIGDDGEGFELLKGLDADRIDVDALIIRGDCVTPTYTKPMLREPDGSMHELNRLDIKNRTKTPRLAEDKIIAALRGLLPRVHGVIIADQVSEADCGVITERVRGELCSLARAYPTVVFAADSRERIGLFEDVILKPNEREALAAIQGADAVTGVEPDREGALACGQALYRRAGQPVFLTLGGDGLIAFHQDGTTAVPAARITGPLDIVGAGDATLAGIVAALCAGATVPEAGEIGCLAAGVTIQQLGTTGAASREQIAALNRG